MILIANESAQHTERLAQDQVVVLEVLTVFVISLKLT